VFDSELLESVVETAAGSQLATRHGRASMRNANCVDSWQN